MSDRRAVSAGHLSTGNRGASSVANETWRVAVGGNRVENMTVDQIAHAFHAGQLNVRTPLWPPGTTGWQALGNFEQFQMQPAAYGGGGGLAQFEEADDDPTRMWTGGPDELPGLEAYGMPEPPPLEPRPLARTGTRQVVSYPAPPVPMSRPAPVAPQASQPVQARPTASLPPSRNPAVAHSSIPPFRKSRGNGLMLVAGLVGLVGLGSAILATRGSWGSASEAAQEEAARSTESPAAESPAEEARQGTSPENAAAAPATVEAKQPVGGEAQLAKYEDGTTSAFVAGERKPTANEAKVPASADAAEDEVNQAAVGTEKAGVRDAENAATAKHEDAPAHAEKHARNGRARSDDAPAKKTRAVPKRAVLAKTKAVPAARVEKAEPVEKAEKPEKAEKAAAEPQQAPANAAVNEAAASALANSATLASSCRPRGGPAGAGKARVIYSNDGEVQSVEILTAKFRDTLTGSCVRMVFRRAKIPAFKGEPPTFIKSFTIPEE
jgi:hypothetical protein